MGRREIRDDKDLMAIIVDGPEAKQALIRRADWSVIDGGTGSVAMETDEEGRHTRPFYKVTGRGEMILDGKRRLTNEAIIELTKGVRWWAKRREVLTVIRLD